MKNPKLIDRIDSDTLTIGELWEELSKFANRRCLDNEMYEGDYPIKVRIAQMETLECLVKAIKDFHRDFLIKK